MSGLNTKEGKKKVYICKCGGTLEQKKQYTITAFRCTKCNSLYDLIDLEGHINKYKNTSSFVNSFKDAIIELESLLNKNINKKITIIVKNANQIKNVFNSIETNFKWSLKHNITTINNLPFSNGGIFDSDLYILFDLHSSKIKGLDHFSINIKN